MYSGFHVTSGSVGRRVTVTVTVPGSANESARSHRHGHGPLAYSLSRSDRDGRAQMQSRPTGPMLFQGVVTVTSHQADSGLGSMFRVSREWGTSGLSATGRHHNTGVRFRQGR